MMESKVISPEEEAELLQEWFETVHFDQESEGIPELKAENDDEESRAMIGAEALIDWFAETRGAPPIVDYSSWDRIDYTELGMSRAAAEEIYNNELSFHSLFMRGNPNHSKKNGQFVKGGGGSASPKDLSVSGSQASSGKSVAQAVSEGKSDPDMMIMSSADTYPFGKHWQASSNMEERAGGLWSESYAGHKQVTKAVGNNKAGRPTLEGIDVAKGHQYTLLQAGAQDLPDGTRSPGKYKEKNLAADIKNSANILQARMDAAPIHSSPLYRGMLMKGENLPKAGDTFDTDISSWAKQRDTAEVFAYASEAPNLGIVGDHAVVMRMVGKKKSADIGDIVGAGIMDDEHIVNGKFKINRVTKKGKSVNIEVEQIL